MLVNLGIYEKGQTLPSKGLGLDGIGAPSEYEKGRFAWLAFKDVTPEELGEAHALCKLPNLAVEDALHAGQVPKMDEYGQKVFVVCRQFERGADGALNVGEVCIFVDSHSVVSVRSGAGAGFTQVRQRAQDEPELLSKGPAFVLYALMDVVVDRYFPIAIDFERRVEQIEARIFAKEDIGGAARKRIAYDLYELKSELGSFKHGVEPMLETTTKLFGGRVPPICEGLGDYFRDVHDHLSRILAGIERMRDTLSSATQTNLAMVTIDESVTTKKLAAWAAIFAASTLLAGVWGMNFKNMPELQWEWGYPIALLSMVVVSAGMWFKFKRIGWL
jgi:magnesium transporter